MSSYGIKDTAQTISVHNSEMGTILGIPAAEGKQLEVRLAADGLCHVMTDGLCSEQQDHNQVSIEYLQEPLLGWGDHDDETHWDIEGYWVADKTIRALDAIFKKPIRDRLLAQAEIEFA